MELAVRAAAATQPVPEEESDEATDATGGEDGEGGAGEGASGDAKERWRAALRDGRAAGLFSTDGGETAAEEGTEEEEEEEEEDTGERAPRLRLVPRTAGVAAAEEARQDQRSGAALAQLARLSRPGAKAAPRVAALGGLR